MSGSPNHEEVRANVERCRDSLDAARKLLALGHYDAAASRAYYAAFHAATAVLVSKGLKFRKHRGLIAAVHRDLVQHGLVSKDAGRALSDLFEVRGVGDYGGPERVAAEEARRAVGFAESFVEETLRLLEGKCN